MTEWLLRAFVRDHENTADPQVRAACGRLSGTVGICANALLFAAKLTASLLAGSVAMAADAVNNLADAASGVISLLGFRMAARPADAEHPYGHARYEYLSGLCISVLILLIGWELLTTGVDRILHPSLAPLSLISAVIMALSIPVKLWLSLFNRRLGKKIDSGALIASAADSLNDMIATSAVLAAALLSHFLHVDLDGFMGTAVALFVLYSGVGLVRETVSPLLGRAPDPEMTKMIRERILTYPGVLGTHDLIVHDYGPGRLFASIHVEMPAETNILESHDVIDNIERDFLRKEGMQLIVHLDPVVTTDPHVTEVREWLCAEVKNIHSGLSIHDLRVVPGKTHTNLIFDCVVPHSVPMERADICRMIRERTTARYPDHFCVITVDESFVTEESSAE